MVKVAVAGGTGGVGRTIVDALLASHKHDVIILSRKTNPDLEAELGVPVIAVDYSSVEALTKALENHEVHTVISGLTSLPNGDEPTHEIELIRAADASKTSRRMVSSNWGLKHDASQIGLLSAVGPKLEADAERKKVKDLETTAFVVGFFLDYWGLPAIKTRLSPMIIILDISNAAAALPGKGETPVNFSLSTDVAKFVVASLDLEKWDQDTYVQSDRITWKEFVRLAEEATGKNFQVTYDSVEKLKAGQVTELPAYKTTNAHIPKEFVSFLVARFGLWFDEGVFDFHPANGFINERLPEIRTKTVREFLNEAWNRA